MLKTLKKPHQKKVNINVCNSLTTKNKIPPR